MKNFMAAVGSALLLPLNAWGGDTQGTLNRVEVRPLTSNGKHVIRFYLNTPPQNDRFHCFSSAPGYVEMTDANSTVDQATLNQALAVALTSTSTGQIIHFDSQGFVNNGINNDPVSCLNVTSVYITPN